MTKTSPVLRPSVASRGSPRAAVVLQAVRTGYEDVERLHGIDLELDPGIHLLVGANGSGKTTLFRAIAGVLPLWSGSVSFPSAKGRRRLGYVAHRPALAPRLTASQELEFWGRVLGLSATERATQAARVVQQLDIQDLMDQRNSELSRGQTQRVAIAKALVGYPSVLLLDEPLSGVDPEAAQRIRDDLRDLGDRGHIILISSHELAALSGMGADVIALSRGRVAAHGSTQELLSNRGTTWMRLRAGRGADSEVSALDLTCRVTDEGLEVQINTRADASRLIRRLVAAGIEVYEFSPIRNDLTEIFLQVQDRDDGD